MINILEKSRWLSSILTFVCFILIFYFSSLTFQGTGGKSAIATIYHFTAFSYLTLFLLISLTQGKRNSYILIGMFIAIIYGITDELHQLLVPGRFFSIGDILVDALGIFLTGISYSNYCRK